MKKIFITGGAGFIGRNLSEQLRYDYKIYAPSHVELDLLDGETIIRYLMKHQFDVVIHAATHDASRNSSKDPKLILRNNLQMFFHLTKHPDLFGKLLYFGSGAEYDLRYLKPNIPEEYFGTHIPVDDYGFSKFIIAKNMENLSNVYNLRIFGCFGKYEDWEIRFISNVICKSIFGLPISLKQNVIFSYLYINDLGQIIQNFIQTHDLKHQDYNCTPGTAIDILSLAKMVLKISGRDLPILVSKEGFKPEYSGANSRLLSEFAGLKFTPMEQAVSELYEWYESNRNVINPELLMTDK